MNDNVINNKKRKIEEVIETRLTCPIENSIYRIPVLLEVCEHTIEFKALKKWFKKEKTCPSCKAALHTINIEELSIDMTMYRIIEDLYPDIHTESLTIERPKFPKNKDILPSYLKDNNDDNQPIIKYKKAKFNDLIVLMTNRETQYEYERLARKNELKTWFDKTVMPKIYKTMVNETDKIKMDFEVQVYYKKGKELPDGELLHEILCEYNRSNSTIYLNAYPESNIIADSVHILIRNQNHDKNMQNRHHRFHHQQDEIDDSDSDDIHSIY